jgi:hypothetical protein
MHLRILLAHQKLFFKKDIFESLEWLKRVLMYLRILQTTRNCFVKKDIFESLEWLKTCFDAFAHTPRPQETVFSKKIFFTDWSGSKRVLMHLRILLDHQKLFSKKLFWNVCSG